MLFAPTADYNLNTVKLNLTGSTIRPAVAKLIPWQGESSKDTTEHEDE